jgi:hypothetical protein
MKHLSRTRRSDGAIDTVDLIIGVILVFIVPVACFAVAAILGPKGKEDPYAFRNRPKFDVPPDAEEVEARWKAAEQFYLPNAKSFVKNAFEQQDPVLKEYFRSWTSQGLKNAKSALAGLRSFITDEKYPEMRPQFASYLPRIDSLEKQIDADIEKVKALDILGRDQ